jgi:hypothetical protein
MGLQGRASQIQNTTCLLRGNDRGKEDLPVDTVAISILSSLGLLYLLILTLHCS